MKFARCCVPDGWASEAEIEVAPEVELLAVDLGDAGWTFEAELSSVGTVRIYCCDGGESVAFDLAPGGPGMRGAIEALVRKAHAAWCERGKPGAPVAQRRAA